MSLVQVIHKKNTLHIEQSFKYRLLGGTIRCDVPSTAEETSTVQTDTLDPYYETSQR
jgi:hypothetical protein